MKDMFNQAKAANPNVTHWDTKNVTDFSYLFLYAEQAQPDTTQWNTAKATTFEAMFYGATRANPQISNWDTSNVTSMRTMFRYATSATPNTRNWTTAKVTDMYGMFLGASKANPDMSQWNIEQVSDMASMLSHSGLTRANYDAALVYFSGQSLLANVVLGAENIFYCHGDTARTNMVTTKNWAITDAGSNCLPDPSIAPDLTALSDLGDSYIDNITANITPEFTVNCQQAGNTIKFYSDLPSTNTLVATHVCAGIGLEKVKTAALFDGNHQLSFTEQNGSYISPNSPALAVTIDADSSSKSATEFVTTWQTDNAGSSNSTSITIPTYGTGYAYQVDWNGDGDYLDSDEATIHNGSITHDFGSAGTYQIRIKGAFPLIYFNNSGDKDKIISLDQWGTGQWKSMAHAFYGAINLQVPATDIPDLSKVRYANHMFHGAAQANQDTSNWQVSSIVNMSGMFKVASAATPNSSAWDTSNVTTMNAMFQHATAANPDTSNWNTSNVTNMYAMFYHAGAATPNTTHWNTSKVTDMYAMFFHATKANPITTNWDTSKVNNMAYLFDTATLATPNTSNWNTASVTNMKSMFNNAISATPDTTSWSTALVTDMAYMFSGTTLANPVTSGWNTAEVTSMIDMFRSAVNATPNTTNWNTSKVNSMYSMFRDATSATPDTSHWNTANVTDMYAMFLRASKAQPITTNWDTSKVTRMTFLFKEALLANPDVSNWDTGVVTRMDSMFYGAANATPQTTHWDTSAVTTMAHMFKSAVLALPDVSQWNTAKVESMTQMFHGATVANPELANWNIGQVTDMTEMLVSSALTQANYDAALLSFSQQTKQSNVVLGADTTAYCYGESARANMITTDNWTITDLGENCPPALNQAADLTRLSDWGGSHSDDITANTTPEFAVSCRSVGDLIMLYSDRPVAHTAIASHSCGSVGIENVEVSALSDGIHNITYTETATGPNGAQTSGYSPALVITIDALSSQKSAADFVTT